MHLVCYEDCEVSTSYDVYLRRSQDVRAVFDSISSKKLLRVMPDKVFCNTTAAGRCLGSIDGRPLYRDDDHLADSTGGKMLATAVTQAILRAHGR